MKLRVSEAPFPGAPVMVMIAGLGRAWRLLAGAAERAESRLSGGGV